MPPSPPTPIPCGKCNCCSPPGQPPCSPGCCKCPPTGDVCFDILDCQAYYLAENPVTEQDNWYPIDSCCDEMSFTMTHALGYPMCTASGHSPSQDGEVDCLATGSGSGMPTGTGTGELPELWGFSGTVCGDCSGGPSRPDGLDPMSGWEVPYWRQEECDGMCLKASLCCCVSPFGAGAAGQGNRCAGGAAIPERSKTCACGITCYKFTMEPFDCHVLPYSVLCPPQTSYPPNPDDTGSFMSACSPCAFLENPTRTGVFGDLPPLPAYTGCDWGCEDYADETGAAMGHWMVWDSCPPEIARGQGSCGVEPYTGVSSCSGTCPNESGTTSFMVLVEGVYESQCDCALGVFDLMCTPEQYGPSGVGFMKSAFVKFTALLTDC
jgi:hypothetical protein